MFFAIQKKALPLQRKITNGVLAHLVERNTGSVEVSGSSPLYSTRKANSERNLSSLVCYIIINDYFCG